LIFFISDLIRITCFIRLHIFCLQMVKLLISLITKMFVFFYFFILKRIEKHTLWWQRLCFDSYFNWNNIILANVGSFSNIFVFYNWYKLSHWILLLNLIINILSLYNLWNFSQTDRQDSVWLNIWRERFKQRFLPFIFSLLKLSIKKFFLKLNS
jgi:hypothetical protein